MLALSSHAHQLNEDIVKSGGFVIVTCVNDHLIIHHFHLVTPDGKRSVSLS